MKVLECSQDFKMIFQTSRDHCAISAGILLKFKLIQAFMVVLVTCKNEEDPIKNANDISQWDFYSDTQGQLTPQSVLTS